MSSPLPAVQSALIAEIGDILVLSVGGIGSQLRLDYWELGGEGSGQFSAADRSGELSPRRVPSELWGRLEALRSEMATTEAGAWLSLSMRIDVNGKITTEFDYNIEPDWSDLMPAYDSFVQEMEWHPRPKGGYPSWFMERMEEAGALARELDAEEW